MVWAALRSGRSAEGYGADVNTLRASGLGIADIFGLWALLRKSCHLRDWFYEDGTSCRCGGRHPKVDMLGESSTAGMLEQRWHPRSAAVPGGVVFPGAVPPRYLDRLARAFRPAPPAGAAPSATRDAAGIGGLAEPLSGRELEVLRLLAEGKPNQQIADELVVSLATVKKHVGHILGKLAAANRTQAVARARVLGLLG
jgi:DNA-binding CsgD family transcriptional regulator